MACFGTFLCRLVLVYCLAIDDKIGLIVLGLVHGEPSLEVGPSTKVLFISFPFPDFWCEIAYHIHCIVISNKIIFLLCNEQFVDYTV